MQLFDANAFIGRPVAGAFPQATLSDLEQALDRTETSRALVWHIAQCECAAQDGNALVAEAVAANANLLGCWAIVPPQTGEVITDDFFTRMGSQRIAALRAFPTPHNYLLRRRVFGGFLDEVSDRKIPLLLSLEHGIGWPQVYDLLEEYPDLTCILCDIGIWSQDRFTWPLLEGFERVYVETSHISVEAGGIDAAVGKYGAGRLVFGTGFPKRYPEAAVLDLIHAQISEGDRELIAHGNLDALIEGARL